MLTTRRSNLLGQDADFGQIFGGGVPKKPMKLIGKAVLNTGLEY
jgi:hypothetical protein